MNREKLTKKLAIGDRLRGAIWGQFVGDAAALGSHWVYDLEEQKKRFPGGVQGFERPSEDHYHHGKKPGDQTHYGDAALLLVETVAKEGAFDPKRFGPRFVETFREGVYHGYLDHATRDTVEIFDEFATRGAAENFDFQQGADDDQQATVSRLACVVVRYQSDPHMLSKVESLARVCQRNDLAIGCAQFSALLLLDLLEGFAPEAALERAQAHVTSKRIRSGSEILRLSREAERLIEQDTTAVTLRFGQSCPLEHSFPSALHSFLRHSDSFETAILATVRAGGDNAGRAALVGAWIGAHVGFSGIRQDWVKRLTHAKEIEEATEGILAAAGNRVGR
jgi:ADP-ribosylglycohydrolase